MTKNGKASQASTKVKQGAIDVQAPKINEYFETDAFAKGTIAGDAVKVAIFVNGIQKRTAPVTAGNYSIYTGDLNLKAGKVFEIAGVTAEGLIGPKTNATVQRVISQEAPVIQKYYVTDATAKGTIEGDSVKVAIFVNGIQRRIAAVTNGNFSIYSGDLGLKVGDTFEVAGITATGVVGPKASATVLSKDTLVAPKIDPYYVKDVNAKGTIEGEAKKVAIFVNGEQKRIGGVTNGKFSIYVADLGLKVGDSFEIAGLTAAGVAGPKTTEIVKAEVSLQLPVINTYTAGNVNAKGTVKGDAAKVAIFVNGVQKRMAGVNNGNFSIYTADLNLKKGDTFEIAAVSKSGTIGPKATATVK